MTRAKYEEYADIKELLHKKRNIVRDAQMAGGDEKPLGKNVDFGGNDNKSYGRKSANGKRKRHVTIRREVKLEHITVTLAIGPDGAKCPVAFQMKGKKIMPALEWDTKYGEKAHIYMTGKEGNTGETFHGYCMEVLFPWLRSRVEDHEWCYYEMDGASIHSNYYTLAMAKAQKIVMHSIVSKSSDNTQSCDHRDHNQVLQQNLRKAMTERMDRAEDAKATLTDAEYTKATTPKTLDNRVIRPVTKWSVPLMVVEQYDKIGPEKIQKAFVETGQWGIYDKVTGVRKQGFFRETILSQDALFKPAEQFLLPKGTKLTSSLDIGANTNYIRDKYGDDVPDNIDLAAMMDSRAGQRYLRMLLLGFQEDSGMVEHVVQTIRRVEAERPNLDTADFDDAAKRIITIKKLAGSPRAIFELPTAKKAAKGGKGGKKKRGRTWSMKSTDFTSTESINRAKSNIRKANGGELCVFSCARLVVVD
jgi:hypothetical protein